MRADTRVKVLIALGLAALWLLTRTPWKRRDDAALQAGPSPAPMRAAPSISSTRDPRPRAPLDREPRVRAQGTGFEAPADSPTINASDDLGSLDHATLSGVAIDDSTGRPIAGLHLRCAVDDQRIVTDEGGRFALSFEVRGVVTHLRVDDLRCERRESFEIEIPRSGDPPSVELHITSMAATGILEISCTDERGEPLPGASVWLESAGRPNPVNLDRVTDADGTLEIEVAAGVWSMGAGCEGRYPVGRRLEDGSRFVGPGERVEEQFTLARNGVIRGAVIGDPLPSRAGFMCLASDRIMRWSIEIDARGAFEVSVPSGATRAWVFIDRKRGSVAQILNIPPGGSVDAIFRLDEGIGIHGHVVDEAGQPIEGAEAESGRADGQAVLQGKTDATGAFEIRGLWGAPDEIRARAPGFVTGWIPIDLETPLDTDFIVRLPRSGGLTVTVVDSRGAPITGAIVRIASREAGSNEPTDWKLTTDGGVTEWEVLEAGEQTLLVERASASRSSVTRAVAVIAAGATARLTITLDD